MPVITAPKNRSVAYASHYGGMDRYLSISMFWREKFFSFIVFIQRLTLLMLWDVRWPWRFYRRTTAMYIALLDFHAHHSFVDSLCANKACGVLCKIFWVLALVPIAVWCFLQYNRKHSLYYTRNLERFAWGATQILLVPFLSVLFRYYILNEDGDLDDPDWQWRSPSSEFGVLFAAFTIVAFVAYTWQRSACNVLYRTPMRHEAYIRSKEIEFKLRFSMSYRNTRAWMISSYTYEAWFWSLARGIVDIVLVLLLAFAPPKVGIIVATVILWLVFLYGFLSVSIYRCTSSCIVENLFNFVIGIDSLLATLQVFDVRNPILIDTTLDSFLYGINGGVVALVFLLSLYFFWDSHTFVALSVAERRAKAKWKRLFGQHASEDQDDDVLFDFNLGPGMHDTNGRRESGSGTDAEGDEFVKEGSFYTKVVSQMDHFYRRTSSYFPLNGASQHMWPVNQCMINELLRCNDDDHFIDVLRSAKNLLDRIGWLHDTPALVSIHDIRINISNLQQCIDVCHRTRITHHSNTIHPLQFTLERQLEHLKYELRVFRWQAVTAGHDPRNMTDVSRTLHKYMKRRGRELALMSPLMRRILMKLVALRIWLQLLGERPAYLILRPENALRNVPVFSSVESSINRHRGSSRRRISQASQLSGDASAGTAEIHEFPDHADAHSLAQLAAASDAAPLLRPETDG